MSCFLFADEEDKNKKINIDDLYARQKDRDLKQLAIFNKILNRVQKRIQTVSRTKQSDKHIWFTIPEYLFGEPVYDKGDCTAYLVTKLEENGFDVKYMHPNTLFVSWKNWVPSYVRTEIKKKTGYIVDEKGNVLEKLDRDGGDKYGDKYGDQDDPNSRMLNERNQPNKTTKVFKPIDQYKPTGNLVYKPEMFEKIEKKIEKRY